ncbi:hypothetical protein C8J57DRAFT_1339211 [Mycena rebaudengoi]|nr:hypothetical protein C8J57DRAFT_1339211 [Mycena rebaudengoi]
MSESRSNTVDSRQSPKRPAASDSAPIHSEEVQSPGPFSWILPALKTRRTRKTWLRCVLVLAASMVLLVDSRTLNNMGQAGFFVAMVAVLLPPSMALSMFLLAATTLLLGMLLGWAWGAASMAAALSVQDKSLLASRTAAARASLDPHISPTLQLQVLTFHGYFLDARVSAVYGAFFFLGTFAMGALRALAPKLAIFSIFGTIVIDAFCTTGPLLPSPQYTVAKIFLIPTVYYLAIAIASLVLIFPESLNHVWLTTLEQTFFGPTLSILALQDTTLSTRASDHAAHAAIASKISAARQKLGGGLQALGAQIALIDLEASVGRLGPGDLKRLAGELRSLGFQASTLLAFQATVSSGHAEDARAAVAMNKKSTTKSEGRFARRNREVTARETRHGHDLDTLAPILDTASQPLRTAAGHAMRGLREWFVDCNARRWTKLFFRRGGKGVEERQARLIEMGAALDAALQEFRTVERVKLIQPFERFFDAETGKLLEGLKGRDDPGMFAVRSLFICFVFCDTLDAFAARLSRVVSLVVELDKKRPVPRIWMPSGFGKIGRKIMSRTTVAEGSDLPLSMGTSSDPTKFREEPTDDEEAEERPARPRNPDALLPTSALGRFFVSLGSVVRFFRSPEGVFALRHALVSLALWIPAVVPSSAWFYYDNKGLWALIMAQMSLATFAGDQLFGVMMRLFGTCVGLLLGMAVWYIGAPGLANGNPYAVVVVTTVFVAPFLLARIAAPPAQMMAHMMIGITIVFTVGYSWLNTHYAQISNSGVGIALGWKRALLVTIGFVAGAIVMLFPRPTSSRTLVRRTLAATIQELGNLFGEEVEAFLAEEARARGGHYEKERVDMCPGEESESPVSPKERRVKKVGQHILSVLGRLQELAPSLKTGRFEPQVQGLWPHKLYELLYAKELKLVTSLALLAGAFSKLDTQWCSILVHRTPFLNPNLLSDIFSNIAILSRALEGGYPLSASLPCLRDRLVYHDMGSRSQGHPMLRNPPTTAVFTEDIDSDDDSHTSEFVAGKVAGSSIGFEELSLSVLMDEQLPTHSTAVVALANILGLIDEIAVIVRELCGETTFRGFDALHHDFLGREEAAMEGIPQRA